MQHPPPASWFCFLLALAIGVIPSFASSQAAEPFPAPTDWPCWRGPNHNGIASSDQTLPLHWSATENVVWKAHVPGRGYSSPIVVGQQVILATADEAKGTQSVLCYHRQTGKLMWTSLVHSGGLMNKKGNKKATQASTTVACDGERLFVNFPNSDAVYTTALDRSGKQLWQTKITDYTVHQGYGSSPAIYGPLVIVSADNKGGGAIAALSRTTGKIEWKHARPAKPNYASPVIFKLAGRDQLLFTGCDLVSSFNPTTGKKLWERPGATTECVTSTVTDGKLMFTSGGYPKNHISAVRTDGSGEVVWENNTRVYVPSMLVSGGYLYAVTDAGMAVCWKSATGEQAWKGRLGGVFTSSPVLVGDQILAMNERGKAFIFSAKPDAFKLLATRQLGDQAFATPTVCGGRIYARVVHLGGETGRQEVLYCLGSSSAK